MTTLVTYDELRRQLDYDPLTGRFVWRINKGRCLCGTAAGTRSGGTRAVQLYEYIKIDQRRYAAHRLAWLFMSGEWPSAAIDHRNGVGTDNRWHNLRLASPTENQANGPLQRNNTSGRKGVTTLKNGSFVAQIHVAGRNHWLGKFKTADEAHAAYMRAALRYFGEFARSE